LHIFLFKKVEKHSNKFSLIPAEEIQAQIKMRPKRFNIPVILWVIETKDDTCHL